MEKKNKWEKNTVLHRTHCLWGYMNYFTKRFMVFGLSRRSPGSFVPAAVEPISDIHAHTLHTHTHTYYNVIIIIIIIIVFASTARTFAVDARLADIRRVKNGFRVRAGKVHYNRYIILVRRTQYYTYIWYVYHTACIIT